MRIEPNGRIVQELPGESTACAAVAALQMLELQEFRGRLDTQLRHRMPPPDWETIEMLYRIAFNAEPPQPRKRCQKCKANGKLYDQPNDTLVTCPECNGIGYSS